MFTYIRRYDVAEIAGQMGMSFGCEGMDRHVVIYKKDCTPSEDEITARRNGELWNEETAAKYFNMVTICVSLSIYINYFQIYFSLAKKNR